jgi:hypothetical protein
MFSKPAESKDRLEEPPERAELGADVLANVVACVSAFRIISGELEPPIERRLGL